MAAWLEQSQVAHYLLALGLVNPRAVLEEDFTVTDVSRRNAVFVVTSSHGPTYVVKQAGAVPGAADTLAREAAVLRALPPLAGLTVPVLAHHDRASARLVLRSPAATREWGDGRSSRGPSVLRARALGRALAAVHAARPVLQAPPVGERLWGLSLPEPAHERLHDLSAGALDVLERVQASRELCDRLRRLRDGASADGFVHGDVRWDNCLALAAHGSRRHTRVLLIDWELAGPGDPAADVGTALAEYLRLWVGSLPIVDPTAPGRLLARARHPLPALQPALRALWEGYRRAGTRPVALRRATELAAVRLLETAVERAQGLARASAHAVALLQVADNMLRDPADAARSLMGLGE